ncbi:MAG: PqqD family protein [Candidatus Tectomicrobia bacterium]|uniref:PqqD family protein n=1 Tax=Tectimicrobiota bacterium TaxID=2528274 RepID=A0A932I5S5_UNCTE|nr:PqqD family protein [Candidatus Tectomicrobia bacterium]
MSDPALSKPRTRGEVLCREVDDGFILYDPRTHKVHSLNASAAYVWDCLDGRQALADIAEGLREFPGAGGRDLLRDVLDAVEGFRREGLLLPEGEGGG